jgi:hypothetical protein
MKDRIRARDKKRRYKRTGRGVEQGAFIVIE